MSEQKKWMGSVPEGCEVCGLPFNGRFYDAKTRGGPWGLLCHRCFSTGPGLNRLGTGYGQEYNKRGKDWIKVAG